MKILQHLFYIASCLIIILTHTACPTVADQTSRPASYDSEYPQIVPEDRIYDNDIRTVQLYRGDYELAFPILYTKDNTYLTLEFDEIMPLDQAESQFTADVINCDANWNPTNVLPIEFLDGFSIDDITMYQRSEFTKIPYVHYTYQFPQNNEFFKQSGNYLLKVYRNNDPKQVVLTRRFIIAEPVTAISFKRVLGNISQRVRLKFLNFDLQPGNLQILDPRIDLKVMCLQNFRWDNMLENLNPIFTTGRTYEYRVDLNKDFSGGNEFRRLDLRTMRLYPEMVRLVEETPDIYNVFLFRDQSRRVNTFKPFNDLNGSFFVNVQEWDNHDYQADYVKVAFTLKPEYPLRDGEEIYIQGKFNDWQQSDFNRMILDTNLNTYEKEIIFKQGMYDYQYFVRKTNGTLNEQTIEGTHQESENFYTILVYYRNMGDRTDRLVGLQHVSYED